MPSQNLLTTLVDGTRQLLRTLHDYVIAGTRRRVDPIADPQSLRRFLETRSSYIAQTSLYGYLRTRAGMRYPELFDDDPFVVAINAAKWHMWLACLSDLSVYAGGMLQRHARPPVKDVGPFMVSLVQTIIDDTGTPEDANEEFPEHAERVMLRLKTCDWEAVTDDEGPFNQSPKALVHYAPVIDELKKLDDQIVRNSVRFHWHEVRRDFREHLDAWALIGSIAADRSGASDR